MKFVVRKLKAADIDSLEAAEWYDEGEQQPGLGDAFVEDLDSTIRLLAKNPLIYSIRFFGCPAASGSDVFASYGVFYLLVETEIRIIAVHHSSRHPRWLHERRRKTGE